MTDCNDLKSQDGKCYSENACRPSLLFEENCRNEEVVTVLPICQLKKGAVVDLLFNEENCQREPNDIENVGGSQACQCLVDNDDCNQCEVDCMSDCNDLSIEEGKCFSENACNKQLLFDEILEY